MKLQPLKFKYKKPHKVKSFKGQKGTKFAVYTTGIKIKENISVDYTQLEAVRRMLSRQTKGRREKKVKNVKHQKYIKMMQLKAAREAKSDNTSKKRKKPKKKFYLIRSTITQPLTKKPLQTRMGKGKGNPYKWIYNVRKSRILLEFSHRKHSLKKIKQIFCKALIKLPRKTKFVFEKKGLKIREYLVVKKTLGLINLGKVKYHASDI